MSVTGVLIRSISRARLAAFEVLRAVSDGAYASDTLRIESRSLDSRDAGLASQIVFGCLRFQGQLDYLIFRYAGRKAADLDLPVRLAIRMAIFQLRYLERVPAHAAVHDSVELVKSQKRAATGLTNAVLRKVTRDPIKWPDLATELSCPEWLLKRWQEHFGPEVARSMAAAALNEPTAYVRLAAPDGFRLQDTGSRSIVPLLDLQPGQTYLDLCAAPGNKTMQALDAVPRLAVACDISWKRLKEVPPVCPRVVLDAAQPLPFAAKFDRVFIDAPCSGTGTLSPNPEIKWRLTEQDFPRFREKQQRIASEAAKLLAPGGKLLYATCSLEQEENEEVIRSLLSNRPGLELEREVWRLPGREPGDGFYAAVLRVVCGAL
jgi:16S rRNA (cytosine967-C5)-methyltransferase